MNAGVNNIDQDGYVDLSYRFQDEATLIVDIRNGDEAACAYIFKVYSAELESFVRSSMRYPETTLRVYSIEEIAMMALKNFFFYIQENKFDRLSENIEFYLRRFANTILIQCEVEQRRQKRFAGSSDVQLSSAVSDSEVLTSTQMINRLHIEDFFASLPERKQQFLQMRLAGFTHDEIAERLKVTVRTVERLAFWARGALQFLLPDQSCHFQMQ